MRPSPLSVLCVLAVFGGGFALGHFRAPASASSATPRASLPPPETAPAGSAAASAPALTLDQIIAQLTDECGRGVWRRSAQWDVILARLSPADFGKLLSALREFVLAPAQDELRRTLLARWAEGDPRSAINFVRALPSSTLRD